MEGGDGDGKREKYEGPAVVTDTRSFGECHMHITMTQPR